MGWQRIPRSAQTDIPCKQCKTPLVAERSCREVTLYCPSCKKTAEVGEYAVKMDEKLEAFINLIPSDRV